MSYDSCTIILWPTLASSNIIPSLTRKRRTINEKGKTVKNSKRGDKQTETNYIH